MILAALLVLSATVSIQIVEAEGLELTPRATLVDALEKEIRARTGWPVRSEEPAWSGACEGEGCPLRVPEGAEALTLSVFVASTRSRVLATRTDGTRAIATAKVDLSPDMAGWRTELRPMVDALYALVPRPAAELGLHDQIGVARDHGARLHQHRLTGALEAQRERREVRAVCDL